MQERIWDSGKPVRISSMETNPRWKKKQKKSTSECESFPLLNSLCTSPITFHRFSFSQWFIPKFFTCGLLSDVVVVLSLRRKGVFGDESRSFGGFLIYIYLLFLSVLLHFSLRMLFKYQCGIAKFLRLPQAKWGEAFCFHRAKIWLVLCARGSECSLWWRGHCPRPGQLIAAGTFPFMHRQESVNSPAANGTVDCSSWQALPGSRGEALD